MVKAKTTAESAVLSRSWKQQFSSALVEATPERLECARIASEALLRAITSFSNAAREEWEGDDSLICTCFCVSEATIAGAIRQNRLKTVNEVMKACRAGGGCRSCWTLIEDMIRLGGEDIA
jgi:NifU-like protein